MTEIVIADTSCLIVLSKTGRLDLLQQLYSQISITEEVADEFGEDCPGWIEIIPIKKDPVFDILKAQLDIGEASAISLALKRKPSLLLIDERKGRKVAQSLGIKIIGTLGLLIQAHKAGRVTSLKQELELLDKAGFYLSKKITEEILQKFGHRQDQ